MSLFTNPFQKYSNPDPSDPRLFKLKWRGEIIEEDIQGLNYARFLRAEYESAYGGSIEIIRQRK